MKKMKKIGSLLVAVLAVGAVSCGGGGDRDGRGGALTLGTEAQGTLSTDDTAIPTPPTAQGAGEHSDAWTVSLTMGTTYVYQTCPARNNWDIVIEARGPGGATDMDNQYCDHGSSGSGENC